MSGSFSGRERVFLKGVTTNGKNKTGRERRQITWKILMKHRPDAKQYRIFTPITKTRRKKKKEKKGNKRASCYSLQFCERPWKNFLEEFEIKTLAGTGINQPENRCIASWTCFLTISAMFQSYQSNNSNGDLTILEPSDKY